MFMGVRYLSFYSDPTGESEILMDFVSYKQLWDSKAGSQAHALIAVDGSSDETIVRSNGQFTARQVNNALDIQAGDHVLELGCGVARIGRGAARSSPTRTIRINSSLRAA